MIELEQSTEEVTEVQEEDIVEDPPIIQKVEHQTEEEDVDLVEEDDRPFIQKQEQE